MDRLTYVTKAIASAASSRWAKGLVLALALSAPILMGVLILKLHTSALPAALLQNRNSETATAQAPQSTQNVLSASSSANNSAAAPTQVSAIESGSSSTCNAILNAGDKDLIALNTEVTQALAQAKKYASTGDFADAGVAASQANQLGKQGSSKQTTYEQELGANHCSAQLAAELGK